MKLIRLSAVAAIMLALTAGRPAIGRPRLVHRPAPPAHRMTARRTTRPHGGFAGASSAAGISRDLGY